MTDRSNTSVTLERRPALLPGRSAGTDRAVVPMVGKALEAAIVVLFIGVMMTTLYGGVIPEYRGSTAAEVGDRTVVAAAGTVEGAVPPTARSVESRTTVDLPTTIHGTNYRIVAADDTLRLDHPHPEVDGAVTLTLPERVVRVEGTWRSGARTTVVVETTEGVTDDAVVVRLVDR